MFIVTRNGRYHGVWKTIPDAVKAIEKEMDGWDIGYVGQYVLTYWKGHNSMNYDIEYTPNISGPLAVFLHPDQSVRRIDRLDNVLAYYGQTVSILDFTFDTMKGA